MDDSDDRPDVLVEIAELSDRLADVRFTTAFRGYDPREVHDLLMVARQALHRMAAAPHVVSPAGGDSREEPSRRLERAEEQAAAILAAAEEGAERRVEDARTEAASVIRNANSEAEQIVTDARREAARVLDEATREADILRREAAEFRDTARAAVLESIRGANAMLNHARDMASAERPGPTSTIGGPAAPQSGELDEQEGDRPDSKTPADVSPPPTPLWLPPSHDSGG